MLEWVGKVPTRLLAMLAFIRVFDPAQVPPRHGAHLTENEAKKAAKAEKQKQLQALRDKSSAEPLQLPTPVLQQKDLSPGKVQGTGQATPTSTTAIGGA